MSYMDIFGPQNTNTASSQNRIQWNELNLNRSTLQAFMKMKESKEGEQEQSYLEKFINASTQGLNRVRQTVRAQELSSDKTEDAVKDKEQEENYLIKFINASTRRLSPPNKELSSYSTEVSDSVRRLSDAIERSETADQPDRNSLYSAAEDLVNRFNTFAGSINSSRNTTVAEKARFIGDMTAAYGSRLGKIGISENSDGTLSIDKDKFSTASENDIQKALGGKNSFAQFIDEQAKQLATYAQADIFQRAGAYSDSGNITTVSNINGSFMNMLG